QCLGTCTFEYAIVPHAGTWYTAGIHQQAERYAAPPIATTQKASGGTLPREFSFLSIEPEELVLSALKKAENEEALVLRVFNTTSSAVQARIHFGLPLSRARLASLAEEDVDQADLGQTEDGAITFPVKGFQIRTLKLRAR
ncbi:MAG: glycosyl hydrolase-related protein, partial [Chloroflexi bacterium]|nr:glycosyl hydrolase-related protein [Chloroflexota bacterium]